MHRLLLHRPPASATSLRRFSLSCRQLHTATAPLHINSGVSLSHAQRSPSFRSSYHPLRSYASQPTIQLGATSPQDVGQLLAAASAGDVDKMREVIERKTCTVNDGDYDRRKVSRDNTARATPPHLSHLPPRPLTQQ